MTSLSKSFSLEEVEALLAAERERCAKVAASWAASNWPTGQTVFAIAAAIRSLAPEPMGGE